jgi:hypothetical protein
VGPRVVPSNVAVGGAHLGIRSTLGGGGGESGGSSMF